MAKHVEENITEYTEVNNILALFCAKVHSGLKENLTGIYLYGSLVWGDFDVETSDIDLLVVTQAGISKKEFSILNEIHMDLVEEFNNWNDRVEIAYIAKAALKTFREKESQIAIISPGELFHFKNAGVDWVINWYLICEKNIILFGESPCLFIENISKDEFILAVKNQAREWSDWVTHTKDSRHYQAYAILTICRALYAINSGEQISKKQAARWVAKEYPEWAVLIENALAWRTDWQNKIVDPLDTYPEVEKFVHQLVSTIKQSK